MKLNIALSSICVLVVGNYYAATEAKIDFQGNLNRIRTFRKVKSEVEESKKAWKFLVKVRDGTFFDSIETLDPAVTYDNHFELGDEIEVNYGVSATLHKGKSATRKIYATGTTTQAGYDLSTRVDLDVMDRSYVDLEFDVDHKESDFSACVDARASTDGSSFDVTTVKGNYVRKTNLLDQAGTLAFTPRYDLSAGTKDVVVQYESGKTKAELKVSKEEKELKVTHKLPFQNTIGVVLSDKGGQHTEIDYERDLDNGGSLNINIKDNIAAVNWGDGNGWVAKASADVDKTGIHNANVRIGTNLEF